MTTAAIRDLDFTKEAHIAAVVRGLETYIPLGDFEIKDDDKVVVFTLTEAIHKIEKYFQ